jgi:PAS domain S-box-containing protein
MNIPNDDQRIFLENIIDTIQESLIVLDEQMRVLTVNRSFLTQFQVSPEETEGRLIYYLGNGQWDIPQLHDLLENIIPHQTRFENFEVQHRFETIGEKVMQLNARRLVRADGKSAMILLAIEDITDRYNMRQQLQESETLYRKFTEEANSIVIGLDRNGIISFFNRFSEKLFGYQRNEVIGKPFLGTILPSVDCRSNDYNTIVNEILIKPEKFYAQECEGIRKDGSKVWFSFSTKGIRALNGTVSEIIIDGNDITELQEARLQLKENSAMLDTLLTFIPDGVIVCDAENIIRYTSRSIEKIFNLPAEYLLNTSGNECLQKIKLYHSDGSQITSPEELPMYKVVQCGKPCSEYELFLQLDGTTKTVSIDAAPIFDTNHQVTGAVGVWHDVTDQKNVERALRESENLFRAAVENYTSLFVIYNKNRRMQYMNKFGLHITGLSEKQIAGKIDEEIIPPEIYKHYLPYLIRAIETKKKQHFEFDLTVNGNFYSYINDYVPLLNENGEVYQILSIAMDITERKKAEKAMKESEERFRTLADNISQLAWMADTNGSIFWFNKRWYEYTGTTHDEIKQKGLSIIVDPDYFEEVMSGYVESVKSGKPWTATFPMRKYDGSYRWFLSHAMPIYNGDHTIIRWFGTNTDVTDLREVQQQLHVAAERFQRMMSSNIIGLVIADFDGSIISGNDYYYNLTGYTEEEFTKKLVTWKSITPPEYLPMDYHAIDQMRQNGSFPPYEKEYIRKDGTRIWVLIAFTALPGSENRCIAYILDISDRKYALKEAQQRHAEIEAILNSITDGYIIMNPEGYIEQMNERARSMIGWTEQIAALPAEERIGKLHFLNEAGERYPIEQIPSWRALHGETVREMILQLKFNNKSIWLTSSASPIVFDGKMLGAILEFADITELHKLQEQIAEERNFVNAILQTSGALITILDNNLRIIRFNKTCEEITGFTADEVKNRSILDLFIPEEEQDALLKAAQHFNRDEPVLEHENHWKTKSGKKHFIRWRNTAWFDADGNVKIIIATGIDITDRLQLEQQLRSYKTNLEFRAEELAESNQDLESFSYSVSHDLRSPLSAVKGFTNILQEDYFDKFDEEGREYLHRIKAGVDKMAELINDILNLSKIGRQQVKREIIDLSSMVRYYLKELTTIEPGRKTEFAIEENVMSNADPRLVHVELENLLRNAWKFTSKKEITRIEFGSIHLDGKTVFYLRDNGIGFDQKFAKKIFEPFRRVHSENEYGGTGIGLSIVQRVVKKHNGEIWAEGTPDVGAAFYFTLDG